MSQYTKIFLLFVLIVSFKVFSQEPYLKNYDTNKGLASNECYKVIQDKKGYIWIASDGGLSRYNGYTFQNFTKKDGLPDNVIIHLFEDTKGRIWVVGLNAQIAYFENETFLPLKKINEFLKTDAKKAQVTSIYLNDKDELQIGFNVFYPYCISYSLQKNTITQQKKIEPSCFFIRTDKPGNFIFGGNNLMPSYNTGMHLTIEQEAKNILIEIGCKIRPAFLRYLKINSYSFIMSVDKKIYMVTNGKISEILTLNTNVLFLYKDKTNQIWALPQNDGAYIFDLATINTKQATHLFEGYSFSSVTQDNESNYWLSSLKNGIYQIPNFNIIHYKIKDNTKNNQMNAVAKYNNTIYTGGFSNYIYELDKQNKLKKGFELADKNEDIFDMINCNNKALIMVGLSSYLFKINAGKINLRGIKNKDRIGGPAYLRYLDVISRNYTLFTGTSNGAAVIYLNDASRKPFDKLPPSTINALYTDTISNYTYLGCVNGLYYTVDTFNTYTKINDSLLNTRINYISKKNNLWVICTKERGLIFWDGKKSWSIDITKGLASNECRKVLTDKQGNIWVSTNKGISKIESVSGEKDKIINLTVNEGLTGDDIHNFNIIENEIWIPNANGVTKFRANINLNDTVAIPVYITSVSIDDSLYKVKLSSEIPYHHNYIKINFNGLSYKNNTNLTYEYRLTGLDTSWKTTKNTQVQFTKLTYGNYLFEVRVLKNNKIQSVENAAFSFVIYPPWYKTWWFMLLSFISIVTLIYLFFLLRFKRFKAREEEKTKLIRMVTETEIKALRAQTNPHFIFNALNSIRLFIIKNDSDQAQFYLMQFAQLMRDVLENSEHDVININKEFSILKTYIELEALRFSKKFKFEINVSEEIIHSDIIIPPLLLQPIVENALWHGLMPLEDREGFLQLKIKRYNKTVIVTVEDNGIGRKKSAEIKIGKSIHKTSKGISITTNRITLFNTKHAEQIKIITTDLEIGTRVELIIENV